MTDPADSTADDPDAARIEALREATQRVVDATSTAYTEDASLDVPARLREEMASRGIDVDDGWVASVAQGIRSGHHVSFEDDPGSAGG